MAPNLLFIGEFLFSVQFYANKIYSARIYWTLEDSKDFFLLTQQSLTAEFKDQGPHHVKSQKEKKTKQEKITQQENTFYT